MRSLCTLPPPQSAQKFDICQQVQQALINPNAYSFVEILKSCIDLGSIGTGNLVYSILVEEFLDTNLFIGNTLLNLYGKNNHFHDANNVFVRMLHRNVVTWNVIVSSHLKHEQEHLVFHLFWRMQLEGLQHDKFTFVSVLKACWNIESLCHGKIIHTLLLAGGCQEDVYVASALIHMYAVCCSIETACIEFRNLPAQNVVAWNALITAFIKDGRNQEALSTFNEMQLSKVQPNEVTFITILRAMSGLTCLSDVMLIHAYVIEANFESHIMFGTSLTDVYAKSGCLQEAERVFKWLPKNCAVVWSVLLSGYVELGTNTDVLNLFKRMQNHGLILNSAIYLSLLRASSKLAVLCLGMLVHTLIVESGDESEEFTRNALISMYMGFRSILDACFIFDGVLDHTVVTWSAMIEGYTELECGEEALALYQRMLKRGASPNNITFLSILEACSIMQSLVEVKRVHMMMKEIGVLGDLIIGNMLIDVYAKCGSIERALEIFRESSKQCPSTWNSIISAYVRHGDGWQALSLFYGMQTAHIKPDNVTYINALKACCCMSTLREGRLVHINSVYDNVEIDATFQSSLIDFYAKHESLEDAEKQFNKSLTQGRAPCNAMITGYAHHGKCQEVFDLLLQMFNKAIMPDAVTIIALIQACSKTASLVHGKLVHQYAVQSGYSLNIIIGNGLIDMYGKCGTILDAQVVFDSLVERDIISWTTLIAAHAFHGEIHMALHCFIRMQEEGFQPNHATLVSLLSACGHAGIVKQAVAYMERIRGDYLLLDTNEHHNTMVDVLGRQGCLMEAEDLMRTTPCVNTTVGWASLLCHCNTYINNNIGKQTFDKFISLDARHGSAYRQMAVLLMNSRELGC
ncbi:hypothetical protein KP509_25G075300 [Ceratopteris richardii]|uniref:Pentatricopeptide repeat-containing protein n=1 Tax=Ceratopteris richardii TaxID=49495 RepID=A0A8T2RRR1_CERRI|nr:hypothetical protein KP509_25G075300 [Ceratopteris richardii]KAH7299157.1 hypothetical protein KP509_25G075300 [Ceratopteris richardii]